MPRSSTHALSLSVATLSLLAGATCALAAPRKAALLRSWELEGSDSHGDYTGTLEASNAPNSRVELEAELVYVDGSERTWSSRGYYAFGAIYARYTLPAGLVGGLGNLGADREVRVTLRPDRLATSLSGRYRTGDDTFTGTETAYREGRAGHGFRWTPRTLARVVSDYGVDEDALLLEAANHDDGNGFFKRSELEAAAEALGEVEEWGLISDIDKTILPPHAYGVDDLPDPYPGVAWLYYEIAWPGATTYVTARDPSMLDGIKDWMEEHELPEGPIETGPKDAPWLSQAEKVRDVKRVLAANPGKRFVFFGDSSHRDPEVYKQILADHPDQVKAMIIHKVTNTVSPHRVVGLHLVENYAEAAAVLFKEGVFDEDAARRTIAAARDEGLSLTDAEVEALLSD